MDAVDTRPAAVVDAGSAEAAAAVANPSDPCLREAQTFPRLTAEQVGRAGAFGTAEDLPAGTVLFQRGDRTVDFFIVLQGHIEIYDPGPDGDRVITVHGERQFTGELDLFNDRLILVGGRIGAGGGRVVRMNRAAFRRTLAAEPDIGEVVMRAFILRRVGFIEHGQAGVTLVASRRGTRAWATACASSVSWAATATRCACSTSTFRGLRARTRERRWPRRALARTTCRW